MGEYASLSSKINFITLQKEAHTAIKISNLTINNHISFCSGLPSLTCAYLIYASEPLPSTSEKRSHIYLLSTYLPPSNQPTNQPQSSISRTTAFVARRTHT